jgi:hypothetical protein
MEQLSTTRLYALRAVYLLIAVAMGAQIWPLIVSHPANVEHMRGVVRAFLGALTLLCVLGLRYPVKMLPLLIFEFAWKAIWVAAFGLPLWLTHELDGATAETMKACLMGVVLVPLVLPWGYVIRHYARARGDRWRGTAESTPMSAAESASMVR